LSCSLGHYRLQDTGYYMGGQRSVSLVLSCSLGHYRLQDTGYYMGGQRLASPVSSS
jgi:hypothetical protein